MWHALQIMTSCLEKQIHQLTRKDLLTSTALLLLLYNTSFMSCSARHMGANWVACRNSGCCASVQACAGSCSGKNPKNM